MALSAAESREQRAKLKLFRNFTFFEVFSSVR